MNIALPRNLEDYVAELARTSGYKGSDEVVLEALSEHQTRRKGMEVVMTPELERLLDEGLENLDQAKTTDELRRRACSGPGSVARPRATWTKFPATSPPTIPKQRNASAGLSSTPPIFSRSILNWDGASAKPARVTRKSVGSLCRSSAIT